MKTIGLIVSFSGVTIYLTECVNPRSIIIVSSCQALSALPNCLDRILWCISMFVEMSFSNEARW